MVNGLSLNYAIFRLFKVSYSENFFNHGEWIVFKLNHSEAYQGGGGGEKGGCNRGIEYRNIGIKNSKYRIIGMKKVKYRNIGNKSRKYRKNPKLSHFYNFEIRK